MFSQNNYRITKIFIGHSVLSCRFSFAQDKEFIKLKGNIPNYGEEE